MFHANTQRLLDYWSARAAPGRAPRRSMIDPGEFRQLTPQCFILGRAGRGGYPVRLAGGFVGALHGRDLVGLDGLALWSERDRLRLQAALEEARRSAGPIVVMAEALTEGPTLSLEVLLAPLSASEGGLERYLGLYQPLAMVSRLQGRLVSELSVRAIRRPGAVNEEMPALRLAALHGRTLPPAGLGLRL
jgi:hypothetical protein